jgi:hypothetical protein
MLNPKALIEFATSCLRDRATPASRHSWPAPLPAHASPPPISPRRGRDRVGSAPRSHGRRGERCRPLLPAVCAVAGARPTRFPSLSSDVPSARAVAARSGTFLQGLGQLQTVDAHARARFDLGAKERDCPVVRSATWVFQQGDGDAQRPFVSAKAMREASTQTWTNSRPSPLAASTSIALSSAVGRRRRDGRRRRCGRVS